MTELQTPAFAVTAYSLMCPLYPAVIGVTLTAFIGTSVSLTFFLLTHYTASQKYLSLCLNYFKAVIFNKVFIIFTYQLKSVNVRGK